MSSLTENEYNIKDLYIVKLKDNYQEYLKQSSNPGYFLYFNPNCYYIVEKCLSKKEEKTQEGFYEFYTECIVGNDFYERFVLEKDSEIPEMFKEMYLFPIDLLKEEEIKYGKISTARIFDIFQLINLTLKDEMNEEFSFVKKKTNNIVR